MNAYQITTNTTMKEYNSRKYWIDGGIIRPATIKAESITEALKEFQKIASDKYGITISSNALKNKNAMYRDDKNGDAVQVGYVITGATEIDDERRYTKQYIDLWVTIQIVINPFEVGGAW